MSDFRDSIKVNVDDLDVHQFNSRKVDNNRIKTDNAKTKVKHKGTGKRKIKGWIKILGGLVLIGSIAGVKMYADNKLKEIEEAQKAVEDIYKEKIAEASGVTKEQVDIWINYSQDGNGETALTDSIIYITGNDGEKYTIDHLDEDSRSVLEMAYGIGERPSVDEIKEMEEKIDTSECKVNTENGEIELELQEKNINEIDENEER